MIIGLGGRNPSLLAFSSLLEDTVRRINGVFTSGNTLGFIWCFCIKKFTRVWKCRSEVSHCYSAWTVKSYRWSYSDRQDWYYSPSHTILVVWIFWLPYISFPVGMTHVSGLMWLLMHRCIYAVSHQSFSVSELHTCFKSGNAVYFFIYNLCIDVHTCCKSTFDSRLHLKFKSENIIYVLISDLKFMWLILASWWSYKDWLVRLVCVWELEYYILNNQILYIFATVYWLHANCLS